MSPAIDEFLKEHGFSLALSTVYGANHPDDDAFVLKRIAIESDDDIRLFRIKLCGLGSLFVPIYSLLLKGRA